MGTYRNHVGLLFQDQSMKASMHDLSIRRDRNEQVFENDEGFGKLSGRNWIIPKAIMVEEAPLSAW